MSEYLKPTAMLLRFFKLKQPIKETVCSYCLSGRAGREIFGSWWQLTDFTALGPHGMTRRAKYFPVWPDLASRYTFMRRTAVFLVFPFFLHIFSWRHMLGCAAFPDPALAIAYISYRDFFYVLSVLIRIRISKTHRCLLPVCKNTRVEDHQDVNQAYGY